MRSDWDLLPRRTSPQRRDWDVLPGQARWRGRATAAVLVLVLALAAVAVGPEPDSSDSGTTVAAPAAPAPAAAPDGSPAGSELAAAVETPASAPLGTALPASSVPGQPPAPVAGQQAPPGQPPTPAGQAPKPDDVPGEWIVELASGQSAEDVAEEHEATEGAEVNQVYTSAVEGYAATMSDDEAQAVAADPRVKSVTRDRMVYAAAESVPTGVRRIGAAPTAVPGADVDVDVAVLDTGISPHADLRLGAGRACNGSSTSDANGHGTHVAGTIGARNQNSGIVGVAPGALMRPVRVLGSDGSGTWSQIICGIDWVRQQGNIEVINMSLSGSGSAGSSCSSSTLRQAICNARNAGVTIVVAAGNESANASGSVPAAFPEVITVSALADFNGLAGGGAGATCRSDVDDTFANFSNYGSPVDIIAPGVCIVSTSRTGGTATMSGTSMAAPHVAGAAALYKAANPGATPAQVQSHLISSGNSNWNNSDDRDSVKEPLLGVGAVSGTPTPSSTSTPTTTASSSSTSTSTTSSTTTTVAPSSISLTVTRQTTWWGSVSALLRWSGASGSSVQLFRGSSATSLASIGTTSNDGSQSNSPGRGTWYYKVCQVNSTVCSPVRSVTL